VYSSTLHLDGMLFVLPVRSASFLKVTDSERLPIGIQK
jgi:hypothetical protein